MFNLSLYQISSKSVQRFSRESITDGQTNRVTFAFIILVWIFFSSFCVIKLKLSGFKKFLRIAINWFKMCPRNENARLLGQASTNRWEISLKKKYPFGHSEIKLGFIASWWGNG